MNAPLPDHIRKALEKASLDDKYALSEGRAFMSGVQALVRLPMLQRQRDPLAGIHTTGVVHGEPRAPGGGGAAGNRLLYRQFRHPAGHAGFCRDRQRLADGRNSPHVEQRHFPRRHGA